MSFKINLSDNIMLLKLYYFCYGFRFHSVLAVIYFAQITHSYALALSVYSICQIAQGLFEVPLGYFSDKYGRSRCLQLGSITFLTAITCYSFSTTYAGLIIAAILDGINRAAFSGNNDALLYETLAEQKQDHRYHEEFGKLNSWIELAGLISGIVGSILAIYSLSLLFKLTIIPQILAVLIGLGITRPRINKMAIHSVVIHLKTSLKMYVSNLRVRYLSIASIVGFAIGESTWSFQAVFYSTFLPTWATSLMMTANFLTSSISFRLSGKLISKFKAIYVLLYQEIISRILYMIALLFPSVASPFLFATASFTYGPSTVAKSSLLQKQYTDTQRATMSSINSLAGNFLSAMISVLIGVVADRYGATRAMLLGQIGLLPIIFIYAKLAKLTTKQVTI